LGIKKQFFSAKQLLGLLLVAFLLSTLDLGSVSAANAMIPLSTAGITVGVDASGAYTITSQTPAWTFGGTVGQALTGITVHTGSDTIGSYKEVTFSYQARTGAIRAYDSKPIVLFTDTYLSTSANHAPFPQLTTYPQHLHHLS